MKQLLYVDCCIRGEQSRTRKLAEAFLAALPQEWQVTRLDLMREGLQPLMPDTLAQRDETAARGELDAPRFRYAHQIAAADAVVMAAPFWDLSFPALLKIYIENVSVDGITFKSTAEGLKGLCRGTELVFLTTRGGIYGEGNDWEQGVPYLAAIQKFFGFDRFHAIAADGLDVQGFDGAGELHRAMERAGELARMLH